LRGKIKELWPTRVTGRGSRDWGRLARKWKSVVRRDVQVNPPFKGGGKPKIKLKARGALASNGATQPWGV